MCIRTTAVAILALGLACAGIGVQTDFDEATDFSRLRTWSFAPQTADLGEAVDARVRRAVRETLSARGYEETAESPDFWIGYDASIAEGGVQQGPDTASRPSWASGGSSRESLATRQGELLIVVVDPESGEVLWTGWATAGVAGDASPVERAAQVQAAVRRVLAEFPPS